jgi:hypothetical protein
MGVAPGRNIGDALARQRIDGVDPRHGPRRGRLALRRSHEGEGDVGNLKTEDRVPNRQIRPVEIGDVGNTEARRILEGSGDE